MFAVAICAVPKLAWCNLPLTVEGLITDKGKIKLDFSAAYANVDRQGVATGEPVTVQTGSTSFVTLPTIIGERVGNSDTVVATVGLRYGLSNKTEVYSRLTALSSSQRSSGVMGNSHIRESGFTNAWLGLNTELKPDDKTPAVLAFAEIALREQHRYSSADMKSALFGVTIYKAIDPVVFSLTSAYRFNQSRQDGGQNYKPGNLLLINPGVAFAVNDRVTLTTGVQWTRRQTDRFDGQSNGLSRTATDLLLGVGYGFAKGNMLNTTLKVNASGRAGAEVRMNWMYTF